MPPHECSIEEVVLGRETRHEWKACQGQHEEGQQAGQHRLAKPQAAYLTIVAATIISPLQYRDNPKGSQVHEGIAEQVEKDGRESNCASYNNTY